jgi:hypothetical protein
VSNLRARGPLAYTNNERAKQLLYALDDHVWGMKITKKLFSKLKSHELSRQGHPNHDACFISKALITSSRVGGHDANPSNDVSSALELALSSVAVAFDEQYESIPDDDIALLARKLCALHKFRKERRRSPRGCSSAVTPLTSLLIAPRGRSLTPPTSMTTPTGTTTATSTTRRRRTALEIIARRRSSRRSCPEHVLP